MHGHRVFAVWRQVDTPQGAGRLDGPWDKEAVSFVQVIEAAFNKEERRLDAQRASACCWAAEL